MADTPTPLEQIAQLLESLAVEARKQDKTAGTYVMRLKAFKLAAREKVASLVLQLMT